MPVGPAHPTATTRLNTPSSGPSAIACSTNPAPPRSPHAAPGTSRGWPSAPARTFRSLSARARGARTPDTPEPRRKLRDRNRGSERAPSSEDTTVPSCCAALSRRAPCGQHRKRSSIREKRSDQLTRRRSKRASLDGFHEPGAATKETFFVSDPDARWVARNLPAGMLPEPVPGGIRVTVETSALSVLGSSSGSVRRRRR